MANVDISVQFEPKTLKAYSRNTAQMDITVSNTTDNTYWSECEIHLQSPLSLAMDSELNSARTRIGILKPNSGAKKAVNLYTRPQNYPDEYPLTIVVYIYDGDGAIAERMEKKVAIHCAAEESTPPAPAMQEQE